MNSKLTANEARELAMKIALAKNDIPHNPNPDYVDWFNRYMNTFNSVLSAIDLYNKNN